LPKTAPRNSDQRNRQTVRGRLRRTGVRPARTRLADPAYDLDISPVWEALGSGPDAPGQQRDAVLRRILAVADVTAALAALLIVTSLINSGSVRLRATDLLLIPLVVIAAKAIGLYDRDQHTLRSTTLDEVPSILYLSVLFGLSVWLLEALLFHGWLDRPQVLALVATTFALLTLGRFVSRGAVGRFEPAERCIILGNALDAARISNKFATSLGVNAEILGRVALRHDEDAIGSLSRPGSLARVVAAERVQRVIVAPDGHDQEEILQVIRLIKALHVKVSVLPRLLEVVGSSSVFEDVDGMTLLGVRQYGVSKSSALLKRSMDLAGAAVVLLLFAPLFAMIAIAIKLGSRGPVFFRQRRIGRRGVVFSMIKFRSMVSNADEVKHELRSLNEVQGGLFKIASDPRITRIGRFIRATSLDELPQLLNVLAGHMSLVGPRPLVEDEDALILGWQRRRLALRPGMTGMWQIFGSSRIPMEEMVKIDYLYGANWSLWLDLKVLLRTVPYVLRRRGV
jgi:exopolysaccharide biosynthesis polyprenyl glycosylphosphotransferase